MAAFPHIRDVRRVIRPAAAVVVTGTLAACASESFTTTTHVDRSGSYSPRLVYAASKYDAVKMDVAGNPFPGSGAAFSRVVYDAVSTTSVARPIPLTLGQGDPDSGYRMIVVANPASRFDRHAACRGERRHADRTGGSVELLMTYCLWQRSITSLRARRDGVTGPGDPALHDMVQQAMVQMFPPIDETRHGGGDFE